MDVGMHSTAATASLEHANVKDGGERPPEVKTRQPKDRAITQQTLRACKPVLDKTWVIFIFLAIAIVLLPIGIVCLIYGLKPKEVVHRYDAQCLPNLGSEESSQWLQTHAGNESALTCTLTITLEEDISGPVYVYYQISNMYQNHRRYVRSRSEEQLAGVEDASLTTCEPQLYFQENRSQIINPCGLVAWTYFNDTYEFTLTRGQSQSPLIMSTTGIAYPSDIKYRFANYTPQFFNPPNPNRGGDNITTTVQMDEQFINWMRVSALPTFRKLYGRINADLKKGDVIKVVVVNQYNTYEFRGKKWLVLGNTTWLGGPNIFLGIVYIVTGGLSLLFALIYTITVVTKPRKFADLTLLERD